MLQLKIYAIPYRRRVPFCNQRLKFHFVSDLHAVRCSKTR
jgi:hypothetical protein